MSSTTATRNRSCAGRCTPQYNDVPVKDAKFSRVPTEASGVKVAYLPPMSGLADREFIKQPGEIGFLIGQGQTAQVLRNLCYQIWTDRETSSAWTDLVKTVEVLFGVTIGAPKYIAERGEITMDYKQGDARLDLSSSGRGLQQTLLLLSHLYANPNTVLLLDEPDAHLEIFRQRQTYQLLNDVAANQRSQVIAASHSEVVLAEAAGRGKVIAFVGRPHTMNDLGGQVVKSLTTIGWDQYYQAEQSGWVLYLEGASDLAILKTFAGILHHRAVSALEHPFVYYVSTNLPQALASTFSACGKGRPICQGSPSSIIWAPRSIRTARSSNSCGTAGRSRTTSAQKRSCWPTHDTTRQTTCSDWLNAVGVSKR